MRVTKSKELHEDGRITWTETRDSEWGNVKTYTVVATLESDVWTDCFCCTCADTDGFQWNDPACRNHGYAASRPCDVHNQPGQPWEDFGPNNDGSVDPRAGTMPMAVDEYRKAVANGEPTH